MRQLHFRELDEDGALVLSGEDGTEYVVPIDDRLRLALRSVRTGAGGTDGGAGSTRAANVSPREVQAMIRSGQTAEDVAQVTGWELARVQRFEGPVLAEREHVVGLAQAAAVRANGRTDGSHTLDRRVRERLRGRGVATAQISWDAARTGHQGPWTVMVVFPAGGRQRRAAWHYDVTNRSVEALDDEARWLSEDEQALPGGLSGHPLLGDRHAEDESAEMMAAMRQRRQQQQRRKRGKAKPVAEPDVQPHGAEDDVLPLEDLAADPGDAGDPSAAHPYPQPRPEQEAVAEGEPAPVYARTRDPQKVSFDEFFGFDGPEEGEVDEDEAAETVGGEAGLPEDEPAEQGDSSELSAESSQGGSGPESKRKARKSVPSWDDIMFGAGGANSDAKPRG